MAHPPRFLDMSSTTLKRPPDMDAAETPGLQSGAARRSWADIGDRPVALILLACFAILAAATWRKWGVPEIDAGAELTTADLIKHGATAYQDVRYYYGPLGLYSLALAFKVFGSSFATAYAFGLVQASAILIAFYVLARQYLTPLVAGLSTWVLLAIGFSGTEFNFVLPHTNSATFGLLLMLLMLLALKRERILTAGLLLGLVGLTRPEFLLAGGLAAVGYIGAGWRMNGRAEALRAAWRLVLPAAVIPLLVYGWFASRAGLGTLIHEDLWPTHFVKVGAKTESNWMPVSLSGLLGLVARAGLYIGLLAALVASALGWRRRRGLSRLLALWPLAGALLAIALIGGVLSATGLLSAQRGAVEYELHHLILGMSWLPALGIAVLLFALLRLKRREGPPLGGSWPADCALILAGAALGTRAYNAFTAEGSYAPYYAAPLVLMLGILHQRIAERWPEARTAVLGALALVGVGLAAFALGGLYVHDNTLVHTPRGSFVTTAAGAAAIQAAVRRVDTETAPGEPILAAPTDGGLYFMTDRPPALHTLTLLPGLIEGSAETAAINRMRREHLALAVVGARDLSVWGAKTFGLDYNRLIGAYLAGSTTSSSVVGSLADPSGGTTPSKGFTIRRIAQHP